MNFPGEWYERANEMKSRLGDAAGTASRHAATASQRLAGSLATGLNATGAVVGEAYAGSTGGTTVNLANG
jgi:hypothetical protein